MVSLPCWWGSPAEREKGREPRKTTARPNKPPRLRSVIICQDFVLPVCDDDLLLDHHPDQSREIQDDDIEKQSPSYLSSSVSKSQRTSQGDADIWHASAHDEFCKPSLCICPSQVHVGLEQRRDQVCTHEHDAMDYWTPTPRHSIVHDAGS